MNAREIAATVSARQASAVETVRDALDRIAVAKALNAVVTVNTECSLAEAAMIDHRLQLGEDMPLAGVPISSRTISGLTAGVSRRDPGFFPTLWHRVTPSPSSD